MQDQIPQDSDNMKWKLQSRLYKCKAPTAEHISDCMTAHPRLHDSSTLLVGPTLPEQGLVSPYRGVGGRES